MDKQRVNKVTAAMQDGDVLISFYCNNKKLATVKNGDLGIPSYNSGEVNNLTKTQYIQHCREIAIDLMEKDGISEFYYDEKKDDNDDPKKFNNKRFKEASAEIIGKMLEEFGISKNDYVIPDAPSHVVVSEEYKDGYIKYGSISRNVEINNGVIMITVEVRSGQLSKPKTFIYLTSEYKFTQTGLKRALKELIINTPPVTKAEGPQKTIEANQSNESKPTATETKEEAKETQGDISKALTENTTEQPTDTNVLSKLMNMVK